MTTKINTLTFSGINITNVDLQIHISPGIPAFVIVGLPDKTIAEARERVRSALYSLGISLPAKKITVNLAPADLIKEGSHFDLPIAVSILAEMKILPEQELNEYLILGELSLDADLIPISGVLPAAVGANSMGMGLICPSKNGAEAAWSGNSKILAADNLINLINHFKGIQILSQPVANIITNRPSQYEMADVRGQYIAKRAIEIAASGGHNLLMCGPPGAGKSMLAQRLNGILPTMSSKEILESSMIKSIANGLSEGKLETNRPFRSPHHSCSMPAMVGGGMGRKIMPGEISLAHNGVLFLDELPEFPRAVLDSLRQPIERGDILISRANSHITYPAKFQLIGAMNPCKCGYLGDKDLSCSKAPKCAFEYQAKISGPLLDRIDLHIDIQALTINDLENTEIGESTEIIKARVDKVRQIQLKRYENYGITTNAELDGNLLFEIISPDQACKDILNEAAQKMKLSMRGYNRVLKVARTIADMEEEDRVSKKHVLEALSYKPVYLRK
ncbi:MAG: YifB family Mg chelatase-like AAA ATPase [Alphaproteobacteria bacterium]